MNTTDGELLRRYTHDRSETAFEELVRRHVNLIYSAALRQVNGDAQLAEDVTQSVFTDLARKAAQLNRHPSLTGWLYTSTRFIAANIRRTEQRRSAREQEAHAMNAFFNSVGPEPDWAQIRPLLDDAMHTLDEQDREAVLLRHFEHRSFAEIGERLGLAENTVRMRVSRALDRLEEALRKRGVTSTALALAGLLTANGVGAAPAHLAAKAARAALAGATTAGGLSVLLAQLFTATKVKFAAAALLAAVVALVVITNRPRPGAAPTANAPAVVNPDKAAIAAASSDPVPTNAPAVAQATAATVTNGLVLHLEIVAADSGQPVPHVPIDYRGWSSDKFDGQRLKSSRLGVCNISYPSNITELALTTREDGFADTKLMWRPLTGEVIPTNYVLRLDRATTIGGRVVDPDGNPIAGAEVRWGHNENLTDLKLPQNHEFGWASATTDVEGRWCMNRIAEDMIVRLRGRAESSNFADSISIQVGQDKNAENQLRAMTHVFRLGRTLTLSGLVVDTNGLGIFDAEISVTGSGSGTGPRLGRSQRDGSFSIPGCEPEMASVTVNAKGYAIATEKIQLRPDSKPIRLVMQAGKNLRLRVVSSEGRRFPGHKFTMTIWTTACVIRTCQNRPRFSSIPRQMGKVGSFGRTLRTWNWPSLRQHRALCARAIL